MQAKGLPGGKGKIRELNCQIHYSDTQQFRINIKILTVQMKKRQERPENTLTANTKRKVVIHQFYQIIQIIIPNLTDTNMLRNNNIRKKITQQRSINEKAEKPYFTTSITDSLQNEYKSTRSEILQYILQEPKIIQIRLKQWLKRLDQISGIDNLKKNRNFYASVLRVMLIKKSITHPFHKIPAESSLPLLNFYQLSFEIREELQKLKKADNFANKANKYCEEGQKQNIDFSNIDFERQQMKQCLKPKGKQKRGIQARLFQKQFEQTLKINSQLSEQFETEKEVENLVRASYNFLLKNQQAFQNKEEITTLLNDLWNSSLSLAIK